jgi:threonine dehydrogenase-like Zn-dependent dehydrogenase
MRAGVWQGQPFNISVLDVSMPVIIDQTDVIVKMSKAAVCGSDLHIYQGTMEGQILPVGIGHEGVGYVSEVGSLVGSLNIGDPVIVPFTSSDGHLNTELTSIPYAAFGNGGALGGAQGILLSYLDYREFGNESPALCGNAFFYQALHSHSNKYLKIDIR